MCYNYFQYEIRRGPKGEAGDNGARGAPGDTSDPVYGKQKSKNYRKQSYMISYHIAFSFKYHSFYFFKNIDGSKGVRGDFGDRGKFEFLYR